MDALFPTYARWDLTVESAEGAIIVDNKGKNTWISFPESQFVI